MKKMNRKRLNNKGFTLMELLAVIVILAIVMGIASTSVLNSINNSRKSSLHSAAQTAANNLNTWVTEDAVVTTIADLKLGNSFISSVGNDTWVCLSTSLTINNGGQSIDILQALGFNSKDIKITGTAPVAPAEGSSTTNASNGNCSAIRYNSKLGSFEIFLAAQSGGKYYVTADGSTKNFAFSRGTAVNEQITD